MKTICELTAICSDGLLRASWPKPLDFPGVITTGHVVVINPEYASRKPEVVFVSLQEGSQQLRFSERYTGIPKSVIKPQLEEEGWEVA